MLLQRAQATLDGPGEKRCDEDIEQQEPNRDPPCPHQVRPERERARLHQALINPSMQAFEPYEVGAKANMVDLAMHHRTGIAFNRTPDADNVAMNDGVGSKLNIT